MSQTVQLETLHQQQGGMPLADFAKLHGRTPESLAKLAKRGRIVGARKHAVTKKWWVYPPAQILTGWM